MSGILGNKIVQIKGSNGSGKTTIVKQLLEGSRACKVVELNDNPLTVMEDIGWVAVGTYPKGKRMGGTDTYSGEPGVVQRTKDAIAAAALTYPDCWVVFEGMVLSTIKTTFYDYLMDMQITYGIVPVFVILEATVDGCIERIKNRRGPDPNGAFAKIREGTVSNVGNKCDMILRHAKEYDPLYVKYIDVERTHTDDMLYEFLKAVGDVELLEALYEVMV